MVALENFNEHFKDICDGHRKVPAKSMTTIQRFNLGAVFVYRLALLYRFENGFDLYMGLNAFLKAT